MKLRTSLLLAALLVAGSALAFAADNPNMGTWKLNAAKSKFSAGATKNHTVSYQAAGDDIKVTVDGTDGSGSAVHSEWTGKFDGKDYPVTGSQAGDTRSYKQVNDRTLQFTEKKDGKVTTSGKITVSADGKTRTVTSTATEAKGKKTTATAVYDKE